MNCRFGGLIAAGVLADLNGAHGIAGWRWLFIIEGSATVGIALIAMYASFLKANSAVLY
jgi:hypothetical protein